ncbi:protein translocase subunit SecD [Formosimonas limnophila]|uniref:Protein translocase subunit SecD n=1 Tax=Formosimonas limnophila TaxID=1384487 RepID=A0A8J3FYJ5_9BURK|nr:protein translocase subunit SecD [Formosimonas limnophila]GHA66407.1 protein translocase subunit SecD [Formosimonas limnophila]
MNRYPLWKYLIMIVVTAAGLLYTLPNIFGEGPAVQISSARSTVKVTADLEPKIAEILAAQNIANQGIYFTQAANNGSFRIRFADVDTQLKAKEVLNSAFNTNPQDPSYTVALNLMSKSPDWLTAIGARPTSLGLDLRGGVHFLMQVDLNGAVQKRLDSLQNELSSTLKDSKITGAQISKNGERIDITFDAPATASLARDEILKKRTDLAVINNAGTLNISLTPEELIKVKTNAVQQNITTLHNRVNALGVAEPLVQQQGIDRIIVELPGVQDTAIAKEIIGRTATLQIRLVETNAAAFDKETFKEQNGASVDLKRQVILTGDAIIDAQSGRDQNGRSSVDVRLNDAGGKIMREVTRENLKKPMAIVLFEKRNGKEVGEAISVATIQGEFGDTFAITGNSSAEENNNLALLLKAGALAAPMDIIEERTIGPSQGADNIEKGFKSLVYGFCAVAVFMILYYRVFGVISVVSLAVNLLLLVGLLTVFRATLTLPGIAAIALTLGMAIDSNVLINERIREELRHGESPQRAIHLGYERAFATILDSNITTLIAGLALLIFGSGPIRGFAVVHCLGILTSMFSAVFFSRGLANFWYGRRQRLSSISIGQIWRGDSTKPNTPA